MWLTSEEERCPLGEERPKCGSAITDQVHHEVGKARSVGMVLG